MDITSGIARASMDMASAKLATDVQVAMLKNVMDVQQESLAILLQSMGIGQRLDIQA